MTSLQYASALTQLAAFLSAAPSFDVGAATPQVLFSFSDAPSFQAAVTAVGDGSFTFRDGQLVEFVASAQPITLRLIGVPLNLSKKAGAVTMTASAVPSQASAAVKSNSNAS